LKRNKVLIKRNIIYFTFITISILIIVIKLFFTDVPTVVFLHNVISPLENYFHGVSLQLEGFTEGIESKKSLLEENEKLRKSINTYNLLLHDYEELQEENKRLKRLLNVKSVKPLKQKIVSVIGRSPDFWNKKIDINLGKKDKIAINTPIISEYGLVGRVLSVYDNSASVLLITDNSSWVSCINNRSRSIGILKPLDNKKGELKYIVANSDFKPNDIIVTSGLGGIYPKGIPVGLVSKAQKGADKEVSYVEVIFLTDFDKFEELIALTKD